MLPAIPDGLEYTSDSVAGVGVRATRDWTAGEFIGDYVGVSMTKPEFQQLYGKDIRHTYYRRQNFVGIRVIVAKDPRNFITYINEGTANVILKKFALWCLTDISSGTELLLRYDPRDYPWDYVV